MSNIETLCEHQNRYKKYIQDFRFNTKEDVHNKTKRMFIKTLIICLYLGVCGISSNYVFAVFFGGEVRNFANFFLDAINSLVFLIGVALSGFISTSVGIAIRKLDLYAYSTPISNTKRLDKLLMVVKHIPELEQLVTQRLRNQGYVSEMDYQVLEIDTIHRNLFH